MRANHRTKPDHPCWHRHWYGGVTAGDTAALCNHPTRCRVAVLIAQYTQK
jgi:hypothetical protein